MLNILYCLVGIYSKYKENNICLDPQAKTIILFNCSYSKDMLFVHLLRWSKVKIISFTINFEERTSPAGNNVTYRNLKYSQLKLGRLKMILNSQNTGVNIFTEYRGKYIFIFCTLRDFYKGNVVLCIENLQLKSNNL